MNELYDLSHHVPQSTRKYTHFNMRSFTSDTLDAIGALVALAFIACLIYWR